jgi:hypothetical protein
MLNCHGKYDKNKKQNEILAKMLNSNGKYRKNKKTPDN